MGLNFVCGLEQPEDILQIGTSKYLVASGMQPGGGISLINTETKTARRLYTGQAKPDRKLYANCDQPDLKLLDTHGLALRPTRTTGLYNLYAVTHSPFESIQVFALDARGAEPAVTWTGCVKLPADFRTNSVTATSDGTILANVQMKGGATGADFINGKITGGVYEWKPADKVLRLLSGTELPGNNGIELSKDESEFYIAVSGTQTVAIYSRADTSKPVRQVRTPWYNLDNIHWSGDRLIVAGMMFDEPACGGTRQQIQARKGNMNCHRGWVAAQLDPVTLQWTILAYGEPNPAFGGIATALVMGDTLWLGSFQMDRLAYRALPVVKPAQPSPTSCAPSMGLSFVCGMIRPEDLLQVGASKYLVYGGSGRSGGIGVIDSQAKTWRQLDISQARPDRKLYPDCPAVPDPKELNAHGIALRTTRTAGLYTLYSVTHAPFESIQVFALDARTGEPSLTWTGCVKIPSSLRTNSVAAASDGTILANVQMKNGAIQADYMVGKITGGVYEWKPSDKAWRLLPGTELAGNNGIELSKDEKEFYVAVSGTQSVEIFSRADTSKPVRQARAIWFNIDNIHWSGERLVATGVMYDEPACGGTRKQIVEREGKLNDCHRGWVAAELDPATLQWTILSYGEGISDFGGASTAQIIGDTMWLSSNQMDRVAYRPLK
jgi:sugar lactone lactonase YvrE